MLHDSCIINGHVPLDLTGNFKIFFSWGGGSIFPNYLMPENNHRNDWILDLFGGPNEAGKYDMKVSLFRPESQKLTESWFVFIPFWYRSNDVSKKSRGLVGRGLGWRQVGSIPPISNFIPLPSHQEVYCNSAKDCHEFRFSIVCIVIGVSSVTTSQRFFLVRSGHLITLNCLYCCCQ